MNKFFKRTTKGNFVVIDSLFPQESPFAFRNSEINEYIKKIDNFDSYTMYPMAPDSDAPFTHAYGVSSELFHRNASGYLRFYPQNKSKLHYLDKNKKYQFKLSYSFFLGETYVLLPFYEKNKIPFTFVLYPGGLFGLNSIESDNMLRKIFASNYFRAVIVTQQITKDYLISKKLCAPEQIYYIYGGFVQFQRDELEPKRLYKNDKNTFDICFVAAKYSAKGVDKGYDLFIAAAKKLAKATDDIMFHVVGGFDETDIDIKEIRHRITFYGIKRPDFLLKFYARMDIFLAPNRPFKLYEGNFDGFPLGIDAGYCGVALFVADELKMNRHYIDGENIVIIKLKPSHIAETVLRYYKDTNALYELSRRGKLRTQDLFDIHAQVEERIKVFSKYTNIEKDQDI